MWFFKIADFQNSKKIGVARMKLLQLRIVCYCRPLFVNIDIHKWEIHLEKRELFAKEFK